MAYISYPVIHGGWASTSVTQTQFATWKQSITTRKPSRPQTRQAAFQMSFVEDMESAMLRKFNSVSIQRVIGAWERMARGEVFKKNWDPTGQDREDFLQLAESYVDGLTAIPFHEPGSKGLEWAKKLEGYYEAIRDELRRAMPEDSYIVKKGNNVWVPAVRAEALPYGPDWRTLVLQDRGVWEPTNCKLFPKTVKALKDCQVPSVEVFFARQAPNTGIAIHSDFNNMICTSHLGLFCPPNQAWIEVGGERKYWEDGHMLVFDTSFMHKTRNESLDRERYVLLIRFWHPELTTTERRALQFIFDAQENPELLEDPAAKRQGAMMPMMDLMDKQANRSSRRATSKKTDGFGV